MVSVASVVQEKELKVFNRLSSRELNVEIVLFSQENTFSPSCSDS